MPTSYLDRVREKAVSILLKTQQLDFELRNIARMADDLVHFMDLRPKEQAALTALDMLGPEPPGGYTARQVGEAFGRSSGWARDHADEFSGAGPTDENNGMWRFPRAGVEHYVAEKSAKMAYPPDPQRRKSLQEMMEGPRKPKRR